jgi:hypothetical protein
LSKNIKFKVYRALILPVVSYDRVAVQITAVLNCQNSSVVEHKLFPRNTSVLLAEFTKKL